VTVVTGAAGFAAGHLLRRLAETPTRLVGWTRPGGSKPAHLPEGVTLASVDITNPTSVQKAVSRIGPDRIFHLAGAASVASSFSGAVPHLRINALGTHHILEAVRRTPRPCRVVVVSSAQVYAASEDPITEDDRLEPQNPYGLTKLAQDMLARSAAAEGLDVMTARPFNHIGPGQEPAFAVASFARQIALIEAGRAPAVLSVGNLETRRDITDVRDVADAYVRIMDGGTSGRAYNVCSGRAWRMRDLLEELLQLARVPIAIETAADRLRPVDVPVVQGDATRLRTELGWMPQIPIERTILETLEYWRTRIAIESD
jgi:GDP-4-dehydro-6-deoxy-D-mannose reductase